MNIIAIFSFALSIFIISCGENKRARQMENKASTERDLSDKDTSIKTIVFFGNSLTAGYGLEPSQAFPALIQKKIDSLNLPYKVINAGVSGETSSGGNNRIDWILREPPDIFILELGANDGLRGLPASETKKNLQSIITKVKSKNPDVTLVLAGMLIPPNMGQKYTAEFRNIYPELAKENNVILIPFILEGVGGEAKFNQEDGIHPTEEGHKIVAENIWNQLRQVLEG